MKTRKIGPGVWTVGPLGEIEMSGAVIRARLDHGLPVPSRQARHLTQARVVDETYRDDLRALVDITALAVEQLRFQVRLLELKKERVLRDAS